MKHKCITIISSAVCLALVVVCGCQKKTSSEDIINYQMQVGNKACIAFAGVQTSGEVRFKRFVANVPESYDVQSAAAGWRNTRSETLNDWREKLETALGKFNATMPSNYPPECAALHDALMESAQLSQKWLDLTDANKNEDLSVWLKQGRELAKQCADASEHLRREVKRDIAPSCAKPFVGVFRLTESASDQEISTDLTFRKTGIVIMELNVSKLVTAGLGFDPGDSFFSSIIMQLDTYFVDGDKISTEGKEGMKKLFMHDGEDLLLTAQTDKTGKLEKLDAPERYKRIE